MKNQKLIILILGLLFLVSPFGQVKASTYYQRSGDVVNVMDQFIIMPLEQLAVLTGDNLVRTFNAFPPFGIAVRGYLKSFAYIGGQAKNILGPLFVKTGDLLAIIPNNFPNFFQVSQDSADFFADAISVFNGGGKFFKTAGDLLAVIPQNLPDLDQVSADVGNFLLASSAMAEESLVTTVAFFQESFNNLTTVPKQNFYPQTQKLMSQTKNQLDANYNKAIGLRQH